MDGGGGQPQQQRGGAGSPQGGNGGGARGAAVAAAVTLPATDSTAIVNPEGTWQYTVESPQGGEGTLSITKDGNAYSGSITNKRFNSNTPLNSVTLKGNELSFGYEVTAQGGNTMPVQVKAIITDDNFNGSMTVGQFGTFPIKAKRDK